MIKAVLFDLYDTLISEKEYVSSGFNVVSKEIANKYNLDCNEVYRRMNAIFEKSSQNVFNRVLASFNILYSKDEILSFISIYRNHKPSIQFYDDVIPTINKLKKNRVKVGIITDGYKETQLRKIEALNCRTLFDEIIITDELGKEFWKPHEKSYKIMAENLEVKFNEMVYIGDNVEKDFKGANNLGILTVRIEREEALYKNINVENEKLAKYEIKKLDDILVNILMRKDLNYEVIDRYTNV